MKKWIALCCMLSIILVFAGCTQSGSLAQPTPEATAEPTPTPTPEPPVDIFPWKTVEVGAISLKVPGECTVDIKDTYTAATYFDAPKDGMGTIFKWDVFIIPGIQTNLENEALISGEYRNTLIDGKIDGIKEKNETFQLLGEGIKVLNEKKMLYIEFLLEDESLKMPMHMTTLMFIHEGQSYGIDLSCADEYYEESKDVLDKILGTISFN
ncbi:MAG: hypothetical protein ACOYJC_02720 [Christensenellales bacterium]|jgi:hypothetical protein